MFFPSHHWVNIITNVTCTVVVVVVVVVVTGLKKNRKSSLVSMAKMVIRVVSVRSIVVVVVIMLVIEMICECVYEGSLEELFSTAEGPRPEGSELPPNQSVISSALAAHPLWAWRGQISFNVLSEVR